MNLDRHRRELHLHCYRLLGSFDQAEDAVQETFLRAWSRRDAFDGDNLRAWLYRIATNVCLDALRKRGRRGGELRSIAEVPWLDPYPDPLLDEAADDVVVRRETIELAFVAALQAVPPRQRAVLVARDVLGWPAAEVASSLGMSVAAANSALQRARVALQAHLPASRADWSSSTGELGTAERDVLARFIDAHERGDAAAALAIAAEDVRVTMPPNPLCFEGRSGLATLLERAFGPDREGDWRLVPTAGVNRMPAAASYLLRPGDTAYRAFKLDVLHVADGRIAEITTFGYRWFDALGLPPVLPAAATR